MKHWLSKLLVFGMAMAVLGACAGSETSGTSSTSTTSTTSTTAGSPVTLLAQTPDKVVAFRDGEGAWRLLELEPFTQGSRTIGRAIVNVTDSAGRYSFARQDGTTAIQEGTVAESALIDWSGVLASPMPDRNWTISIEGIPSGELAQVMTNYRSSPSPLPPGDRVVNSVGPTDMVAAYPSLTSGDPTSIEVIPRYGLTDNGGTIPFDFGSSDAVPLEKVSLPGVGDRTSNLQLVTGGGASLYVPTRREGGVLQAYFPPIASLPAGSRFFGVHAEGAATSMGREREIYWGGNSVMDLNIMPAMLPAINVISASRLDDAQRIYRFELNAFDAGAEYFFVTSRRSYSVSSGRMQMSGSSATYVSPSMVQLAQLPGFGLALSEPMPNRADIGVKLDGFPFGAPNTGFPFSDTLPPAIAGKPGVLFLASNIADVLVQ